MGNTSKFYEGAAHYVVEVTPPTLYPLGMFPRIFYIRYEGSRWLVREGDIWGNTYPF